MDEVFVEAINIFMDMVNVWELTKYEKKLLRLSEKGNAGAFCDLLASQEVQMDEKFDGFFAWLREQPE